ncbi:MAG TPA: hypothetical protein VFZ61_00135 [Polyangiales bacterium]
MMRTIVLAGAALAAGQLLLGCATHDVTDDRSAAQRLEDDFGGPGGLMHYLSQADSDEMIPTAATRLPRGGS